MNPAKRKIWRLRDLMKDRGIDACIIPNADPHLGEYIPDHWKIIQWLTGFTGSSAMLLVTKSFAGLWTDSRYFIQAGKQLEGSGIQLMKMNFPGIPSVAEWLRLNMKRGGLTGFDSRLVSEAAFRKYMEAVRSREVSFDTHADLISEIWDNRPEMPGSTVFEHPLEFAGEGRESKIGRLREEMGKREVDFQLITSPDEIMWLLNIRAGDVQWSPLLISFALVSMDQVLLFTFENRIPPKLAAEFDRTSIVLLPYDEINIVLSSLPQDSSILVSPENTSVSLFRSLNEKCDIIEGGSLAAGLKAVKNETELASLRHAMLKDGVSLTRFFFWLEKNIGREPVTESSAAKKLRDLRLQQSNCTGESFASIVAFNEHSAMPHYETGSEGETAIETGGILLVDSGGQYLDGTTDITRCIATGKPTSEQQRDFTLALKGTITIAAARFPAGTKGFQLDILGRKALWDNGMNYGHGTGHGIGFFLNVHEGPQSISPSAEGSYKTDLIPGMLLSDEPGVYSEGRYGFRTENILAVTGGSLTEFGKFLEFETLTLCYIDTSLIEKSLLDQDEIRWINRYHSMVYDKLGPLLTEEESMWLKEKSKEI